LTLRGRDINKYEIVFGGVHVLFDPKQLWSNTDESRLLKCPKIIVRQTSDSLIAAIDETGYLCMDTTHLIFDARVDMKYLLGLLNSRLMNWYYQEMVVEEGRAFAEVKIANLKLLPIQRDEKASERISSVVQNVLNAKRKSGTDTSRLEREIDKLVYALYNLNPEEIAIVEYSAKSD